jgi:hypothetical protein
MRSKKKRKLGDRPGALPLLGKAINHRLLKLFNTPIIDATFQDSSIKAVIRCIDNDQGGRYRTIHTDEGRIKVRSACLLEMG